MKTAVVTSPRSSSPPPPLPEPRRLPPSPITRFCVRPSRCLASRPTWVALPRRGVCGAPSTSSQACAYGCDAVRGARDASPAREGVPRYRNADDDHAGHVSRRATREGRERVAARARTGAARVHVARHPRGRRGWRKHRGGSGPGRRRGLGHRRPHARCTDFPLSAPARCRVAADRRGGALAVDPRAYPARLCSCGGEAARGARVKVLVVLAQPPLPEGEAPARCAVGLIRGLKANGVEVRTLAAKQDYALAGSPPGDLDVEVVDVIPQDGGWLSLRPLRRPRGELAAPAFKARLAALAADVAVVHLHYLVRRDRTFGVPWRRQFRDVLEFQLAERGAVGRHRFLAASSPLVADAVRRAAPHAEVTLAPLTLDPLYYEPAPLDEPPRAGLIGTAAWTPTAAAVERLVERVWPLVRRELPDAQLRIAGRGMRELHLHGPGIGVLGEVPSAAEFLRSLSVLLYPLERGSGVKVKVLESIASGLPVVTTPAGAEGIDGGDGVLIEDSDVALAHAAAAILRDEEDRRRRGAAALQAFGERYTPEVATRPLVALYERMARR